MVNTKLTHRHLLFVASDAADLSVVWQRYMLC